MSYYHKTLQTRHGRSLCSAACPSALCSLVSSSRANKLSFTCSPLHKKYYTLSTGDRISNFVCLLATTSPEPVRCTEAPFKFANDEAYCDRVVAHYLNRLDLYAHDIDAQHMGPGTFCGPKKYIQHATRTEMFYQYRAYCTANGQEPSSYTLFLRVANKLLGITSRNSHLGTRKMSEHAQCDTCWRLKQRIRQAKTEQLRRAAYETYSKHILSQWLDRQMYWSWRANSLKYFQADIQLGHRTLSFAELLFFGIIFSTKTVLGDYLSKSKIILT